MEPNTINASELKDRVSLIDLLSRLGFEPLRKSGKEQIYLSMLRDSDTKPSFCVNETLNVWYDHGTGKGGNLIDFGIVYWQLNFKETLFKIAELMGQTISGFTCDRPVKRRHALKLPHYKVEEIKPLGNNPEITEFLNSRGVWEAAQGRLQEIYYFVEDEKKLKKYFFAAGWQNELSSWEVRNKYFKGCLGHKAITFIPGNEDKLSVFEGFINYLSWLTENPFADDSILVLNTITLVFAAVKRASGFQQVSVYFDRDIIGFQATGDFIKSVPQAIDTSAVYKGHNDYNDKIVREASKGTGIPRKWR